jgi:hypothetical protein
VLTQDGLVAWIQPPPRSRISMCSRTTRSPRRCARQIARRSTVI